jgi:hypothetical protein
MDVIYRKFIYVRASLALGVLAALAFVSSAPLVYAQETLTAVPAFTEDDSAVYSAVLRELYQAAKGRPVILSDQTALGVPPGMVGNLPVQGPQTITFLDKISPEARQNYEDINHSSLRLAAPCKFAPECTLVNLADVALQVKDAKAWRKFMAKHANTPGIIIVSRVGFNRARDQAVVYSGMSCGLLCGQGEFTWLTKHNGVWAVEASSVVWISTK